MKTIVFQSDSGSPDCPEWHMWRLGGIGGSDAPILAANAGLVKRAKWMDSIQTLWEMKTGKRGPKTANKAMIRGREYENAARVAYEHSTGNLVNSAFGEDDKLSFVRASFDGLSFDGNLIVEIKVPGEHTMKLVREGQIPEHYLPQLAHQAVVAWGEPGQSWVGNACHFAAYVPETRELKWLPADVQRLAALAQDLLKEESLFWDAVRTGVPPCGDDWQQAASLWLSAHRELEAAKAAEARSRERVIALLGNDTQRVGAGIQVMRSTRRGTVDYEGLLREYGVPVERMDSYRKASSTSFVIKTMGRA